MSRAERGFVVVRRKGGYRELWGWRGRSRRLDRGAERRFLSDEPTEAKTNVVGCMTEVKRRGTGK